MREINFTVSQRNIPRDKNDAIMFCLLLLLWSNLKNLKIWICFAPVLELTKVIPTLSSWTWQMLRLYIMQMKDFHFEIRISPLTLKQVQWKLPRCYYVNQQTLKVYANTEMNWFDPFRLFFTVSDGRYAIVVSIIHRFWSFLKEFSAMYIRVGSWLFKIASMLLGSCILMQASVAILQRATFSFSPSNGPLLLYILR